MSIKQHIFRVIILSLLTLLMSCGGGGDLQFNANGEEFIRDGFISKDGWHLDFDKVLVNLGNITAYNHYDEELEALTLPGSYLIDLSGGSADDPSVPVALLEDVPPGNYQSLQFSVLQLKEGPYEGASIILEGTAVKDERTIPFIIRLDEELGFVGKDGFVGDEIKGLVKKNGLSSVEMTFHFDHIFGDIEAAPDEHVNAGTPGFDLFLAFEEDGRIDLSQEELRSSPDYPKLMKSYDSLGHLGEGHCDVIR